MKTIKLFTVLFLTGVMFFASCVKNEESEGVRSLREAQASKYDAEAAAVLIEAEAAASYKAAEAAVQMAIAAVNEATIAKTNAEAQKLVNEAAGVLLDNDAKQLANDAKQLENDFEAANNALILAKTQADDDFDAAQNAEILAAAIEANDLVAAKNAQELAKLHATTEQAIAEAQLEVEKLSLQLAQNEYAIAQNALDMKKNAYLMAQDSVNHEVAMTALANQIELAQIDAATLLMNNQRAYEVAFKALEDAVAADMLDDQVLADYVTAYDTKYAEIFALQNDIVNMTAQIASDKLTNTTSDANQKSLWDKQIAALEIDIQRQERELAVLKDQLTDPDAIQNAIVANTKSMTTLDEQIDAKDIEIVQQQTLISAKTIEKTAVTNNHNIASLAESTLNTEMGEKLDTYQKAVENFDNFISEGSDVAEYITWFNNPVYDGIPRNVEPSWLEGAGVLQYANLIGATWTSLVAYDDEIALLKVDSLGYESDIVDLEEEIAVINDESIPNKQAEITAKETEITAKEAEITAKEAEIEAQQVKVDAQQVKVDAQQVLLDAKQDGIDAKQGEIDAKQDVRTASDDFYDQKIAEQEDIMNQQLALYTNYDIAASAQQFIINAQIDIVNSLDGEIFTPVLDSTDIVDNLIPAQQNIIDAPGSTPAQVADAEVEKASLLTELDGITSDLAALRVRKASALATQKVAEGAQEAALVKRDAVGASGVTYLTAEDARDALIGKKSTDAQTILADIILLNDEKLILVDQWLILDNTFTILNAKLTSLNNELTSLNNELSTLETGFNGLSTLKTQLSNFEDEIVGFEDAISTKEVEISSKKVLIAGKEKSIEERMQVKGYVAQVVAYLEVEGLTNVLLADLQEKMDIAKADYDEVKAEYDAAVLLTEVAQVAVDSISEEKDLLDDALTVMTDVKDALVAERLGLSNINTNLDAQLTALTGVEDQIVTLENVIAGLEDDIDEKESLLAKLVDIDKVQWEALIAIEEAKLVKLKADLEIKNAEAAEIYALIEARSAE